MIRKQAMNPLQTALQNSDDWVLEFEYVDSRGQRTRRVVSPIRMLTGERFLGLCLSREEPRQFYLQRCYNMVIRPAHDVLMPIPIEVAA